MMSRTGRDRLLRIGRAVSLDGVGQGLLLIAKVRLRSIHLEVYRLLFLVRRILVTILVNVS